MDYGRFPRIVQTENENPYLFLLLAYLCMDGRPKGGVTKDQQTVRQPSELAQRKRLTFFKMESKPMMLLF